MASRMPNTADFLTFLCLHSRVDTADSLSWGVRRGWPYEGEDEGEDVPLSLLSQRKAPLPEFVYRRYIHASISNMVKSASNTNKSEKLVVVKTKIKDAVLLRVRVPEKEKIIKVLVGRSEMIEDVKQKIAEHTGMSADEFRLTNKKKDLCVKHTVSRCHLSFKSVVRVEMESVTNKAKRKKTQHKN